MIKKVFAAMVSLLIVLAAPEPHVYASDAVTGEITVSCYDTMRFKSLLEYAAKSFEQKYPGTKVNVTTFSEMPQIKTTILEDGNMIMASENTTDSKTEEDYIARINTEIMSGGGADIYAVDILPYYKYADSGLLEDLREYMDSDSDFDYADYQSNIFDATLYKGSQYILPIDYNFNCLSLDSTLMDEKAQERFSFGKYTYKELVELGYDSFIDHFESDTGYPVKLFNLYSNDSSQTGGTLFYELLSSDYNAIIDITNKKANFTEGRFIDILEISKEYSDKGYLYTPPDYQAMMREGINVMDLLNSQAGEKYIYKSINQLMLIYSFLDLEDLVGGFGSGSLTKDDTLIGLLSNSRDESTFTSSHVYAMSSNSKNKGTAWEFLKFLLSDEIQGSMSISFTPVSKNAEAQKAKLMISSVMREPVDDTEMTGSEDTPAGSEEASADSEEAPADSEEVPDGSEEAPAENNDAESGDISTDYDVYAALDELASHSYFDSNVDLSAKQQEVFDNYMEQMEKYYSLLNSYTIRDSIIDEMIIKEVQSFFDGTKTAKDVASALQSRVNMYLQE